MIKDATIKSGVGAAVAAYIMWGFAPIFFKQLEGISAFEIVMHRIIWSFVLLSIILFVTRGYRQVFNALKNPKVCKVLPLAGLVLACNWFGFIWAVTSGHVLEASLGYFINPLLYVFLGLVFFHETLRRMQWLALSIAGIGVVLAIIAFGHIPWVAFGLAFSFGSYGSLKKTLSISVLAGLYIETVVMLPIALTYFIYFIDSPTSNMLENTTLVNTLFIATGVVTTAPLFAFSFAVSRIPLSLIGFIQYLGPSLMFILGVFIYHEQFDIAKVITFGFIWIALLVFILDALLISRRQQLKVTE